MRLWALLCGVYEGLEQRGEQRGEQWGTIKTQVAIIENLLRLGEAWSRIEAITDVNEAQFEVLKQQLGDVADESRSDR